MSTRTTTIIILLLILGATVAGLLLWSQLPEEMASPWNINDEVDDYMPKFWGVFLMPMVSLGLFLLFLVIPNIDPNKANIAAFRASFNLFIVLFVVFMLYVHGLTLAWNLGYTGFRLSIALVPAIGLLFVFIGFMLQRAKRNFFIGIRTPWTLSSDRVWDKTHRLGAILFIASGVLAFFSGLSGGTTAFWMLFVPLLGSVIFLLVYSYVLYQQETKL